MNINVPNKKFVQGQMDEFRSFLLGRFQKAASDRDEKADRYDMGYKLYEGLLPEPHKDDVAPIVVPMVRTIVDKLQPSQMNIFTENEEQAVVFRPQKTSLPQEVVEGVNIKINDVFLRENNGYNILANAIREALCTGDAFIKVFVEEEVFEEELDLQGQPIPMEMAAIFLKDFPDTDPSQVEEDTIKVDDPMTGTKVDIPVFRAKDDKVITLKRIERKPRIEFTPFNEMFVMSDAVDIKDARYLCHRMKKSVGELVDMGFDQTLVLDAADSRRLDGMALSTKKMANDGTLTDDEPEEGQKYGLDPMEREVYLYEHYIYTSLFDKKMKSKLYQVYAMNVSDVLEVNEVARIPFVHGVPDRIPGSFWGKSMADLFGDDQIFLSNILRDYATYSKAIVHPKWMVLKGQYDKASLLNVGRPGAVVEESASGAIRPFTPMGSPQDLLQVMTFVQGNAQDGINNTAGIGIDPSNMAGMTATAVAASVHNTEMKDKRIAKSFAYTLIRPLFEQLYHLFRDEDLAIQCTTKGQGPDGQVVEQEVPYQGSNLPSRSEFYIDVNTANDDAQQVQTLMGAMNSIAQLGGTQTGLISPNNLFQMGKRLLRSANITNVDDYLSDPALNVPDPEMVARQQQEEAAAKQMQMDMANAQVGLAVAQQVEVETRTSEMLRDNSHRREMEEREQLRKMEELEVKKTTSEAKIAHDEMRNDIRETELYMEAKSGNNIALS